MKVLIVDDDPLAGLSLKHFVEKAGGTVTQHVTDGAAALRTLAEGGFDAILLDLELPEVDGRGVLKAVPPGVPVVVVSSHTDFGAGSYDFDVVDYLVKPVDYARFHRAWQKLAARLRDRPAPTAGRTIVVRDGGKLVQIPLARLLFLEAESNYTRFVCTDRSLLTLISLKQLAGTLPPEFLRVHRSFIVNTRLIEQIEGAAIKLGAHKVPIGETYREEVLKRFSPVN
jgi:DNA-binding LytR/AlgR family response regulator